MIDWKDFVYHLRERTTQEFDKKNHKLLSETVSEITSSHVASLLGMLKGADFLSEEKIYLFALFRKAEDLLISALHLARQRAIIEALSLLRIAIEAVATAINIYNDQEAFDDYLKSTYKSTHSITYAKKYIPLIGKIWGGLSRSVLHINSLTYGPDITINENAEVIQESLIIDYSSRPGNPSEDRLILLAIQLTSCIVNRSFELVFLQETTLYGHQGFKIPCTDLTIIGRRSNKKIAQIYDLFTDAQDSR